MTMTNVHPGEKITRFVGNSDLENKEEGIEAVVDETVKEGTSPGNTPFYYIFLRKSISFNVI